MGEIQSEESDVGCEGLRCFLSLTVLLVESDQPTQKIVASILKKCGYRVIAVSDGLKAWNKLNEHPDTIDLVLTEVDLVTISGFNLLTMIMEHEICRNIPVIMMSSNESITTVFKCMLKGAADFLIKPIRKNELRILWQHVWRRRQTPIYGENGCKEKNLFRSQIAFFSGKNASSDYSSNFMDDKQDKGNLGDKGSDAESACTKEDSEGENTVDMENVRENLQPKVDVRYPLDTSKQNVEVGLEPELRLYNSEIRKSELNQETEGVRTLTTIRDDSPFLHLEGRNVGQDACNVAENCSSEDKYQSSTPQLELSLSRSSPKNPSGEFVPYTLNHSNASPFSWYGSRGTLAPGLRSNICNTDSIECTLFYDSSSEQIPGKKIENPINVQSEHSNEENVTCRCDQAGVIHHSVPSREMPAYNISTGYGGVLERTFHQTDPETLLNDCNRMYTLNMTNENLNLKESNEQNHSADRTQNTSISLSIGEKRPRFEESCYGITGDYCIIPTVSAMNSKDGYGGIILQHEPSTNREAALNKFRLKRKNRCFEKKVRYESRKKLAEQRPRVKGQFVRQTKGRPSSMETTIYQRQTLAS